MRLVKGDEFITKCLAERPPEKVQNIPKQEYLHMSLFSIVKDKKQILNNQFPCQVAAGGSGGRQVTEEEVRRVMSQAIVRQVALEKLLLLLTSNNYRRSSSPRAIVIQVSFSYDNC